jgi:hypothetical protein
MNTRPDSNGPSSAQRVVRGSAHRRAHHHPPTPDQLCAFLIIGIALDVLAELADYLVQRLDLFGCDSGLGDLDQLQNRAGSTMEKNLAGSPGSPSVSRASRHACFKMGRACIFQVLIGGWVV